jgi:hypothetical protein
VRYVGKAVDLASRLRVHRCESKSGRFNDHKNRWLRSIDCKPVVQVLEVVTPDKWAEAERRWIAEMRSRGCELTNYCDGGDTSPMEGKQHSQESIEKMRAAAIRNNARPPSRAGSTTPISVREKLSHSARKSGRKPPHRGGWNKGIGRTHCKNGHEYTPDNTRIVNLRDRSYQSCRTCERATQLRFRQSRKAAGV